MLSLCSVTPIIGSENTGDFEAFSFSQLHKSFYLIYYTQAVSILYIIVS